MGTLKQDIKKQSDWIVKAFASDKFKLDYSLDSIIEVDRFFKENLKNGVPRKGGRLPKSGFGPILFSIGSYVGETIIKNVKGAKWVTDDNDPEGEINALVELPDGAQIWPIQKVMKRLQFGNEDAIYPYVQMITKKFTNHPFNDAFWALTAEKSERDRQKPWWKFW